MGTRGAPHLVYLRAHRRRRRLCLGREGAEQIRSNLHTESRTQTSQQGVGSWAPVLGMPAVVVAKAFERAASTATDLIAALAQLHRHHAPRHRLPRRTNPCHPPGGGWRSVVCD